MMPVRRYSDQEWLPSVFNDFFDNDWVLRTNTASPSVNIIESDADYKIEVAAPGMTKDDFSINLSSDNEIVIAMEKKTENNEKDASGKKYLRREFSYSQFKQSFTLPDNVDRDKIAARVENGVLTIDLPKLSEADKAKICHRIEIN